MMLNFGNKSALEAEETEERERESKERTTKVLKLTEEVGSTEAGIKVFEDVDPKEQRATARQGIMRMLGLRRY